MRLRTAMLVALCLASAPVQAENPQFSVEIFRPSLHPYDLLSVRTSAVPDHLQFGVGTYANYGRDPLSFVNGENRHRVVTDMVATDMFFSLGVGKTVDLAFGMPMFPYVAGRSYDADASDRFIKVAPLKTFSTGDLRVSPKIKLLDSREQPVGLAMEFEFTAPTASKGNFTGEKGPTFSPRVIVDTNVKGYRGAVNLGYMMRDDQTLDVLTVGDELFFAAGAGVPILRERLEAIAEVFGATKADSFFETGHNNYVEGDGALRYTLPFGLAFTAGGGGGFLKGYGNPEFRVVGGVQYSPEMSRLRDRDHDGILDAQDRCPIAAEDWDRFQDTDGCPEPDNDADGIDDPKDRCPLDPEDLDGFADADGCPEPDNDGDSVLDGDDNCPLQAEDMDRYKDQDGCPDPDNDNDGVADGADGCPLEPETKNGFQDEDGCPDTQQRVVIVGKKIEISEKIFFATGKDKILPRSFAILVDLARTLNDHPEIKGLRVEGHTDNVGNAKANERLSEKRAKAVVDFLVKQGVARSRLQFKGFGPAKPIADNATEDGRATNRRMEFTITGQ